MEELKKFLSKEELKQKAKEWQISTSSQESKKKKNNPSEQETHIQYRFNRVEGNQGYPFSINGLHGASFLEDVIPSLIEKKKKGEKVKILDIGAGAAFFADQIRKTFPNDVKVYSTGLSKKTAIDYRKEYKPEGEYKLNPNDLKWRSIFELTDFEEFDLIIETHGELEYITKHSDALRDQTIIDYLTIIIKKLKIGGIASLAPLYVFAVASKGNFEDVLHSLEEKYQVKITLPESGKLSGAIRIQK